MQLSQLMAGDSLAMRTRYSGDPSLGLQLKKTPDVYTGSFQGDAGNLKQARERWEKFSSALLGCVEDSRLHLDAC